MCRHQKESIPTHLAPLLRHSFARSRHGSAYHSDPVRPSRPERDRHLPPSLRTSPPRDRESSGLAEAERRTAERIDEPAAPRGGRSHPHRGSCLHRTKSPVAQLEAPPTAPGHCALSHRRTRRSYRSVHPLRASRHLLQLLPKPPLPEVSDRCPRPLDRRASKGTPPDALRSRGL